MATHPPRIRERTDVIRILHVDDDTALLDLAADALKHEDERFTITTATSASDGLDCLATDEFDCIVSDYQMPGRDGIEFLTAVRDEYPELPFILFTGKGSEELASEAISAGVTDYLQKKTGTDQYTVLANRIKNAVESVRAQRERERHLNAIETAQEGISILNQDEEFVYVNQAYADLYGYDPEELIGEHWEVLYRDEDIPQIRTDVLPQVRETGTWHGTTTGLRDDGTTFIEDHVLSLTENNNLICTVRDITERETLREKHESVVKASTDAFWEWDLQTDTVSRSQEYLSQFGYEPSDFVPGPEWWRERIHPEDRERVLEAVQQAREDPEHTFDETYRFQKRDGSYGYLRTRGYVITDADGEPARIVGAHIDVTEQKEREQELRELTERLDEQYRYLFEEAPLMAVVTRAEDGKPIIEDCNQRFVDRLGYEKEDVLGRELPELYTTDSERRLLDEGGYDRALQGEFVREDRELIAADGEHVETMLRAVPRRDARKDIVGTLAMYIDISERKALEREKSRLEELTSVMSHDLRNPLNVAQARIELAAEEYESDHLLSARGALDRMEELIEDLLTLARSGEDVPEKDPIALGHLSQHAWQHVETDDASLQVEIERTVRGDRSRLQQLFENLYRNAIEHGDEAVTVTVGEIKNGFYVEDTGPGIPDAEHSQIFEAGYTTADHGTGIGLSIVKQVCEAHGWDISVTNGVEGGARFEIQGVEFTE